MMKENKDSENNPEKKRWFNFKGMLWSDTKDKKPSTEILKNKRVTVINPLRGLDFVPENFKGKIDVVSLEDTEYIESKLKSEEIENICLSNAIQTKNKENSGTTIVTIDNGKCFLCGRCEEVYPRLFKMGKSPKLAVRDREQLVDTTELIYQPRDQKIVNVNINEKNIDEPSYEYLGNELKGKIKSLFGRSLAIREVDGGSCNGCEVEITALNNPIYDIERFGIHFVSSPRHADVLLVTGPVSQQMVVALKKTYQATPEPKIVIAAGACACSGGIFGNTYATTGGVDTILHVDVYIPGCPPRPEALLYGLLTAMDKIKS